MSYFTQVSYSDSGSLDAFSRLRVSTPDELFTTQCQYNTASLQMESFNTGAGVAPAHNASTRMVALTCTNTGTSGMQSYQYCPYAPGRSHFIAVTGLFGTAVASSTVDVGYFDANNGVILRQNGGGTINTTMLQLILRTATGGSASDANIVNQSAWNIDKMDGTGASGLTFDHTKTWILIIDLQFLGMGRVRVGFDVNGVLYYVHQFLNAQNLTVPYMQTGTLPIGMLVTSTGGNKTAYFKCASVMSEGESSHMFGFRETTPETTATAASGARTVLAAMRPKTTFNSLPNRQMVILHAMNLIVTGTPSVQWELVLGGNYSGQAWSDVNATYSGVEYASTPGTYTNLTGGIAIASGYCAGIGGANNPTNPIRIVFDEHMTIQYPLTLDRAGAVRALGTLTLLVSGIGGTSACRGSFSFAEIR